MAFLICLKALSQDCFFSRQHNIGKIRVDPDVGLTGTHDGYKVICGLHRGELIVQMLIQVCELVVMVTRASLSGSCGGVL